MTEQKSVKLPNILIIAYMLVGIGALMINLGSRTISVPYPATALTALYIAVNGITTIAVHYAIAPALPYYVLNVVIGVAVDLVLKRRLPDKAKAALTGAIIGPFFYTLYFPLITHAFRESQGIPVETFITTISLFQSTYHNVMALTFLPAIFFGFIGSLMPYRLARRLES